MFHISLLLCKDWALWILSTVKKLNWSFHLFQTLPFLFSLLQYTYVCVIFGILSSCFLPTCFQWNWPLFVIKYVVCFLFLHFVVCVNFLKWSMKSHMCSLFWSVITFVIISVPFMKYRCYVDQNYVALGGHLFLFCFWNVYYPNWCIINSSKFSFKWLDDLI